MAESAEYLAFIKDQMSGFGDVSVRRMFGGAGISLDELTFAIVVEEILYFKSDAVSEPEFAAEGLEPFAYRGKNGRRVVMSYRRAPPRVMDEADEMVLWCRRAYEAALRGKERKGQGKSRR